MKFFCIFIKFIIFLFLVLQTGCATYETNYYTPEEANLLILSSIVANDARCSMGHNFTIPIFVKVEKKSTDLCVLKILSQDCTIWGSIYPIPAECTLIFARTK